MAGDASENVFNVIDAFTVPRFSYSLDRKKFLPDKSLGRPEPKLLAGKYNSIFMYYLKKMMKEDLIDKGWINVRVCWCVKFGNKSQSDNQQICCILLQHGKL